ncbi:MAG: chorismate synthase [Lachnospiraceae bacterium]|nr:chorismate synthase [Lachnospiraceae bacterium]
MAGSVLGTIFRVMTWGESHGKGIGVTIDGCPAGLSLQEEDIQQYLNRRKPGQSRLTTGRQEGDQVEILSGVFEGKTTGTPIALAVRNLDQRSRDYRAIMDVYRPGHADYCFDAKYGFRDYRGGGRSSGRETAGRVAAGAVACRLLAHYGIRVDAYTKSIGRIEADPGRFDLAERENNRLYMPDAVAAAEAEAYVEELIREQDSCGGIVECRIRGLPAGVGEPVFDKLDACLAKAVMSVGAVKGVEIGDGFAAARSRGSENNDAFYRGADGTVRKKTNHSGGILGGISDGDDIILRAAFKPTPSIARQQQTVNRAGEDVEIEVKGRHDPVVVPRAVVVVEAMAALTVADLLLMGRCAKL